MNVTIPYIQQTFERFNGQIFGGQLPMPTICLSRAKTFVGACTYRRRRGKWGKTERYDFKLRISTRLELSEQEVEDVILHEMIHYYIAYKQVEDSSAHGRYFRQMMERINRDFHRHIVISHTSTREQREQLVDRRERPHVVAVVSLRDGRMGVKVLPRVKESILKFYNGITKSREICGVRLYMSMNPFFNAFPVSSALRVHLVEREKLYEPLQDALDIACDGYRLTLQERTSDRR